MTHKTHTLLAIICCTLLAACSKKSVTGFYTTNPDNKAAFAGRELSLNPDGTFEMNAWTDSYTIKTDENGNFICDEVKSIGSGTYTENNKELHLNFTNIDYSEINIGLKEKENADSSWYEITIVMKNENGKSFSSPTLSIHNREDEPMQYKYCRGESPFNLHVRKTDAVYALRIGMFGTRDFEFIFHEHGEGKHRFEMNRCRGYYAPGTELTIPFKLTRSGIEYTNEQGNKIKLTRAK